MQITEALRNLYKAVTGATEPPTDQQIADLVQKLADNWPVAPAAYTLPAATAAALGGVKKAAAVTFAVDGATAATCATAIKAIMDALKGAGIMA